MRLSSGDLELAAIGLATSAMTALGGAMAIRLRSRIDALAAFGSGVVIGVALLDLLPESLELGRGQYSQLTLTTLMMAGFIIYLAVHWIGIWSGARGGSLARNVGPATLVAHSIIDGVAIGLAFHLSAAAGTLVAIAVLTHDVLDGSNTVTLAIGNGLEVQRAKFWLMLDVIAPLVGIGFSREINASAAVLSPLLALFAGIFLFIGAGELLPRSRPDRGGGAGVLQTLAGAVLVGVTALFGSV